jgi:hypothetical protein
MFQPGDTVIFNPSHFNPEFWDGLSEFDKRKYYGVFFDLNCLIDKETTVWHKETKTYGHPLTAYKPKLLSYICGHYCIDVDSNERISTGHCTLMDLDTGELLPMCHEVDFRIATDEEC